MFSISKMCQSVYHYNLTSLPCRCLLAPSLFILHQSLKTGHKKKKFNLYERIHNILKLLGIVVLTKQDKIVRLFIYIFYHRLTHWCTSEYLQHQNCVCKINCSSHVQVNEGTCHTVQQCATMVLENNGGLWHRGIKTNFTFILR